VSFDISTIAGNFKGAASQFANIQKAAKGLLCLPSILSKFKAPAGGGGGGGMMGSLLSGMANAAAGSIASQIQQRISQLANTALQPLLRTINNIKSLIGNIQGLLSKLSGNKTKHVDLRAYLFEKQDCAVQAANFMNCIINIVAKKVTKKVMPSVNKQFDQLQKDITAEAFRANGMLDNYVNRQVKEAEKLTRQLSLML